MLARPPSLNPLLMKTRLSLALLCAGSLFAAEPQADERESTLGTKPGRIVTMVGPGASAPAAPPVAGQPSAAPVAMPAVRAIGRCAMHRGRGYVVVVRTLESLYEQSKAGYDGLFEGFTFKDADPVYPPRPSVAPSGGPSALPSGAAPATGPSAAPSAGASGAPSAKPSGAPSAAPSGAPGATPSGSPAGLASPAASPRPAA